MEIIGTSKQSTVINTSNICDALHDLVPFVQFKKCKNSSLGVFFTFFKLDKRYQIRQTIAYGIKEKSTHTYKHSHIHTHPHKHPHTHTNTHTHTHIQQISQEHYEVQRTAIGRLPLNPLTPGVH